MGKYKLFTNYFILLFGFYLVFTACNNSSAPLLTQPLGDVSDITNVTVSKLGESEIDQLTTVSKLPVDACNETDKNIACSIIASQILKWGWGFCENDEATLHAKVPKVQVELIVDGIRIPDDLIYQRDETYNRQQLAYCHTWSIKLSNWESGSTVRLENRNNLSPLVPQYNIFVLNVE